VIYYIVLTWHIKYFSGSIVLGEFFYNTQFMELS